MKHQFLAATALLGLCYGAAAQTLIPKAVNQTGSNKATVPTVGAKSGNASASAGTASTSAAVYTVGSSSSTVSSAPKTYKANVASASAVRSSAPKAVSKMTATVPVADRERPAAVASTTYDPRLRTNVHFELSKTNLVNGYLDNSATLKDLKAFLDTIPSEQIQLIEIVSKASPEGPLGLNENLAEGRAAAVASYVHSIHPEYDYLVITNPCGESWDELANYVRKDRNLSADSKAKTLRVIESSAALESKKASMKALGQDATVGDIYKYLKDSYYILIRNVAVYVTLGKYSEDGN